VRACASTRSAFELFAGEKIAPGFFGWIIPYGADSGLVGLGLDGKRASPSITS